MKIFENYSIAKLSIKQTLFPEGYFVEDFSKTGEILGKLFNLPDSSEAIGRMLKRNFDEWKNSTPKEVFYMDSTEWLAARFVHTYNGDLELKLE